MITKFTKFYESKEDEMAVIILLTDQFLGKSDKPTWLATNKQYIKKYLGSYFNSIEAIIDPKDYDTIGELEGVSDIMPNNDPMEATGPDEIKQSAHPEPEGGDNAITLGVDQDGNFRTNLDDDGPDDGKTKIYGVGPGGKIGKLGSMTSTEFGDWISKIAAMSNDADEEEEDIEEGDNDLDGEDPSRTALTDGLTFDVLTSAEYAKIDPDSAKTLDLNISFWRKDDGAMYDQNIYQFHEFDDIPIYEVTEGEFEYQGPLTRAQMIKTIEAIGFEYKKQ